jgi:predicted dehydrogenase
MTGTKTIQLGLIGAGRWGRRYIETIDTMSDARLARLGSQNPGSAELVPPDCIISEKWQEVAEASDIDGLILATPPEFHAEMAVHAINKNIPVLIEKPMSLDVGQAVEIATAARQKDCPVLVGHTHLYSAAYDALKERASDLGPLRRIVSIGGNRGPFQRNVGAMWDYAPHDIALCLDLAAAPPESLDARYLENSGINDHTVAIALNFPNGVTARIEAGNLMLEKRRIFEAWFDGGKLVYDDLADHKLAFSPVQSAIIEPIEISGEMPLLRQIRAFICAISDKQKSATSMDIGIEVVEILAACQLRLDQSD